MGLAGILSRLDDFEGTRGKMTMADNLLSCCFSAYEYGQMTGDERHIFESYVRDKIGTIGHLEAARRLVLGGIF